MNKFAIEYITDLYLDTDSVVDTNRLVLALASTISENTHNILSYSNVVNDEYDKFMENEESLHCFTQGKRYKDFYEKVLKSFSDEEYLCRFKMKRSTVQALVTFLKDNANPQSGTVCLDKKVHIFLWLLTSSASYSDTGVLFGLHKSSIGYIFHEIAAMLYEVKYNLITWPSLEDQHITRLKVYNTYKFPNCVGFLDANCFRIASKLSKKDTSVNYILLQAVCDENLMFVDVFVGEIGKLRKNRVFKDSPLASELENFVDFDNHVLAGSDYKLHNNLITPYTCDEILTSEEMKFNNVHKKTHSYISYAFQMLKDKFLRLSPIDVKPDSVKTLIYAACVLHNFVLLHEGNAGVIKEETVTCDEAVTIDSEIVKNAVEKREFLCNYINFIDDKYLDN